MNSIRKNYFLACCKQLDDNIDLDFVHETEPYGGMIGIGDSYLENMLKHFKIVRLHAVLHDAAGYVRNHSAKGPGYCYTLKQFPYNSCILGHIPGLLFCTFLKFTDEFFHILDC